MIRDKISPTLAESLLHSRGEDWFDVIVELPIKKTREEPSPSRSERIAKLKREFAEHATPLEKTIREMGGEITGEAWINGSLRARVARNMIPALTDQLQVRRIDLPHQLTPESA